MQASEENWSWKRKKKTFIITKSNKDIGFYFSHQNNFLNWVKSHRKLVSWTIKCIFSVGIGINDIKNLWTKKNDFFFYLDFLIFMQLFICKGMHKILLNICQLLIISFSLIQYLDEGHLSDDAYFNFNNGPFHFRVRWVFKVQFQ